METFQVEQHVDELQNYTFSVVRKGKREIWNKNTPLHSIINSRFESSHVL